MKGFLRRAAGRDEKGMIVEGDEKMDDIILVQPVRIIQQDSSDYGEWEREILAYRQEFLEKGDSINGSRGLHHYEAIEGWLEQIRDCAFDNNSYIGVPVTTFLALRKESGRAEGIPHIVGNIEIRHRLNPTLEELGGHIGYSVRPSERRKGYAVRMLRETLAFARGLGLERVMLDCDADNTGSLKTILKCGGVFEKDTLCEYRGKQIRNRHFWISLT